MLASQTFSGVDVSVYTVPTGKRAVVYVDIFTSSSQDITFKINNIVYWQGDMVGLKSFKLTLNATDNLTVSGTGTIHVHGILLNV